MNRRAVYTFVFLSSAALITLFFWSRGQDATPVPSESTVAAQPVVESPTELINKEPASEAPAKPSAYAIDIDQDQVFKAANVENKNKLKTLRDILVSKNDNDPRLDTDFKNLTPEMKAHLRGFYQKLQPEDRNARGTVVFLIGRELTTPEDAAFLQSVLEEAPCLSLGDCEQVNEEKIDAHHSEIDDVTKNYPQFVVLNRIEKWLSQTQVNPSTALKEAVLAALKAGAGSPVPAVAERAIFLLKQFKERY